MSIYILKERTYLYITDCDKGRYKECLIRINKTLMYLHKCELLIADSMGKVYPAPGVEPAGMKAGVFFRLKKKDLVKLPSGSEIFMLPGRAAVGYDPLSGKFITFYDDPFSKEKKPCFPVAAFLSPGFTVTYNSAYTERRKAVSLPLFSYAAVCLYGGEFYAASFRVDRELRQDLRYMSFDKIRKNAAAFKKLFPKNRLLKHLTNCALCYGCPAAKNLFLHRYEAPLPASPYCNSRCLGCISYQPDKCLSVTQPRITFVPKSEEIAELALFHIENTTDPVVSYGQGCEGEPLMVGEVIEKSITLIRRKTSKGIINMNTNASLPEMLGRLFDAGLDSIRVSLNSAQAEYYTRYYKPYRYSFQSVIKSIKTAKRKNKFVSVNYFVMPGFTDSRKEIRAFYDFAERQKINMVQWRNLNYDPVRYFRELKIPAGRESLCGVREAVAVFKRKFPGIMTGYFNPSKERIKRNILSGNAKSFMRQHKNTPPD